MNLTKLPKPAKEASKATLEMMESDDTIDLFDATISKGWWTMVEEAEDGTRNPKVNKKQDILYLLTFLNFVNHLAIFFTEYNLV